MKLIKKYINAMQAGAPFPILLTFMGISIFVVGLLYLVRLIVYTSAPLTLGLLFICLIVIAANLLKEYWDWWRS